MSKHTPGPWSTDTSDCGAPLACTTIAIRGPDGFPLAGVTLHWLRGTFDSYPNKNELDFDEAAKNAHLIAAAPEMLEALQHIASYDADRLGAIGLALAQAAIAKATGEQS